MSETPLPSDELQELRRQARLNDLRLKIARQNEALSALRRSGHRDKLEGYCDPSNHFNIRDYLFETPHFGGAIPTTRNDRDEGRNFPIFRTEQELAVIRGAARLLTSSNPIAVGVLASLTNYVIGNGFQYTTSARRPSAGELAATANTVIDEFLCENDWLGDLDRELFQRSRVDGEYFLGLWHVGKGHVQARAIEPDQVTEPSNKSGIEEWLGCSHTFVSNWGFGVHTHEDDAQAVHGFYVQWSNRDTDWDYFPGGNEPIIPPGGAGTWVEHAKLNVVRSVKRGLSDFYPIDGNLELARRVLRNMGEGSAVQAAIAWIQEVAPGTTQAQVSTGTLARADGSCTTLTQQGASRMHPVQQYDPATILKVPSGQKYLPGPLGAQHAPNFITAAEALLRTVALRWNLPEHLITGSAANNNFASSLVAETPFVKYAESQQQYYAQRDRKTLWRVLWFAWSAGRFGDVPWPTLRRSLEITVTPPQIEVRDPEKETRVRQMLHEAGILSRKTWSAQESLDFDQEQKNLLQEEPEVPAAPGPRHASEDNPRAMAESLERWDPSKHPRGGNPDNTGEFSKAPGGGAAVESPARVLVHSISRKGPNSVAARTVHPANVAYRSIGGKEYVFFQRVPGGDWYRVEKRERIKTDDNGNPVYVGLSTTPQKVIDLTGAVKVDPVTAYGLNHPGDPGWAAIAKHYGDKYLPVSPDSFNEDVANSGEVLGPAARYAGKTIGATLIGGALAKGVAKAIGKAAGALGRGGKKGAAKAIAKVNDRMKPGVKGKFHDAPSQADLRSKTLDAGTKELTKSGLTRKKQSDGSYDFVDSQGRVRARWVPRSGKEPGHWSKFEPSGNQKHYLDNAGRPVDGADASHRIPSG